MMWDDLFARKSWILGLSPMDGVTDAPMRYMVSKYGKVDVMFTEFVSVDALSRVSEPRKAELVLRALIKVEEVAPQTVYTGGQVAQVFGHTPELFYQAAVLIGALGFDGMDINMGCPAHSVEELGSGAGLIRTPKLAQEIVSAAKRGVADWVAGKVGVAELDYAPAVKEWVISHSRSGITGGDKAIPVSVKTRIGVERNQVEEWIPAIMETEPAILSVHGRTLKQLYQGTADWEVIARAAEIVHKMGGKILGNGDVKSVASAEQKVAEYGVDGILIGRAFEGNPTLTEASKEQRIKYLIEHATIYNKLFVEPAEPDYRERAFMPLRKHLAWYAGGFPGASELRQKLVLSKNLDEVMQVVGKYV